MGQNEDKLDRENDALMSAAYTSRPANMPIDEHLFRQSQHDALQIFLERRQKYGNHLDNAKRFPIEDRSGLYLKCTRMVRMIESGAPLDDDTLIDMANYCHLILTARTVP